MSLLDIIRGKMNLKPEVLQIVQEAWKTAKKYPVSREGMAQALRDFGGQQTLKQGLKALESPKVKSTLGSFGVDTEELKNIGASFLERQESDTSAENIRNRLSKLQGK